MAEKKGLKKKVMKGKGKYARIRNNKEREISNLKRVLQSCGLREATTYAEKEQIPGSLQRLLAKRKLSTRPNKNVHKARGNPANRKAPRTPFTLPVRW